MQVRRCSHLMIELDCAPRFEFSTLLNGGDGLDRSPRWLAYAAHREEPAPVQLAELAVLQGVSEECWTPLAELETQHDAALLHRLLDLGLLIGDHQAHAEWRARDARLRNVAWWPPAATAHSHGRWTGIDVKARAERGEDLSADDMLDAFGTPPSQVYRRDPGVEALRLAPPRSSAFDAQLAQRRTCRNFDGAAILGAADFSTMLRRVWGAVGTLTLAPDVVAVKKTSPAGGGLHCVEAYVLVQRVEGLAAGAYHYLCHEHRLEPLQLLEANVAAALAHQFVAGQHWFANVPAMVVMTARFDRLFWKYRRHAKAWRVAHLDVGHLSQTMFLSAVDLGLSAFVTAAINDQAIEAALSLESEREGAIAVVGFGARAAEMRTLEMDQLVPTAATLACGTL